MSSESLLKYKASRCGQLLAQSSLPDEFKKTIIENIDKATEESLDNLLESLEIEQVELERLEKELGEFEKEENEQWKELQKKQEDLAQKLVDEFMVDEMRAKI